MKLALAQMLVEPGEWARNLERAERCIAASAAEQLLIADIPIRDL